MVMRLIDTTTLALTEQWDPKNIPNYAILSHTWGDDEVTFQDIQNAKGKPSASIAQTSGYQKIVHSCTIARASGFQYVWIDTCCINKQSSAELSEAINSMYRYYREAQVCYVALADVPSDKDPARKGSAFRKSRWFTRGWTLQELIAPLSVIFFAKDWVEIGTKSSLQDVIEDVTGIPSVVLLVNYPGEISIAQRMSWAAKRETKYVEDMAYSLMGIFGVNMPTLYGEGSSAFLRLQQEIIRTSDDQSIFAWRDKSARGAERGLLASSPADFIDSGVVERYDFAKTRMPFTVTNQGLRISLPMIMAPPPGPSGVYLGILNCKLRYQSENALGIYLKKVQDTSHQYVRVQLQHVVVAKGIQIPDKSSEIYVKEPDPSKFDVGEWMRRKSTYPFHVTGVPMPREMGFGLREIFPPKAWVRTKGTNLIVIDHSGTAAALKFVREDTHESFVLLLGVHNWNVWSDIVTHSDIGDETCEQILDSYYKDSKRSPVRSFGLDRVARVLNDGRVAQVAITTRQFGPDFENETQYCADIRVRPADPARPVTNDTIQQHAGPPAYVYSVQTSIGNSGFFIMEVYPPDFWESMPNRYRRLAMHGSGTSGIMMLQNQQNGEKFAVMLGIHNYRPWMDIVTNFGNESADNIRNSYYVSNGRGAMLWENKTSMKKMLGRGRTVNAITTSNDFLGEAGLHTDITIH